MHKKGNTKPVDQVFQSIAMSFVDERVQPEVLTQLKETVQALSQPLHIQDSHVWCGQLLCRGHHKVSLLAPPQT